MEQRLEYLKDELIFIFFLQHFNKNNELETRFYDDESNFLNRGDGWIPYLYELEEFIDKYLMKNMENIRIKRDKTLGSVIYIIEGKQMEFYLFRQLLFQ